MEVTLGTGYVELKLGTDNIRTIMAPVAEVHYLVSKRPVQPDTLVNDFTLNQTYTFDTNYRVRIEMPNRKWEEIVLSEVTNQVTWTNDATGAAAAVAAIRTALNIVTP